MPPKKRPKELNPVKFLSVDQVFTPDVQVEALKDINGWVDRGYNNNQPVKFHIGKGRRGMMDKETARIFAAKGYITVLNGDTGQPVSEDELAELTSKDHKVEL